MRNVLLIAAAGVGARMALGYPKQYLPMNEEKTLLEVTVSRLASMGLFEIIAVVVSADDAYIDDQHLPSEVRVLRCGGPTRGQSVANGLQALIERGELTDCDRVFVHDAARPCVAKVDIEALIEALNEEAIDGAILAQPQTDTVKWVNAEGIIEQTLDRRQCFRAQTPQAFLALKLQAALKDCAHMVTDEAQAMEMAGARVKVVCARYPNIKVTHQEDVPVALQILKEANL